MANYGYHRISTKDQHADRGVHEIKEHCSAHGISITGDVFCDKQTGKNFNRPEYQFIKNRIQPGDMLIITEMDRLGRNKVEILKELQHFRERGVYVVIIEIPTTQQDFSKMENSIAKMIMETINNMLIEMYAVFAQVEIEKKEKRQREGIEAKRRRGEWEDYGRPHVIAWESFTSAYREVLAGRLKPAELQRKLNMKPTTYYRYRSRYHSENAT